jgi:fido (protein-threonine AMPylation protein)
MENIIPIHLQEIIFSSSESKVSKLISKLESEQKIRKIAPRIYSSNFSDEPSEIIRRNLFLILGKLYPGALLSHRTALEFKPTKTGLIFVTYTYSKKLDLPGVTIRFIKGSGPILGDNPLNGELYVSQLERALLENLEENRQKGDDSKSVGLTTIEERLELIVRTKGEAGLNQCRDKARLIATELGFEKEFQKLNKLISSLLNTNSHKILSSPQAIARVFGHPFDPARVVLLEKLFITLRAKEFKDNFASQNDVYFKNFAFFEAYFSNYIEGTEFEIEEAKKIIDTDTPLLARNEDSHDILGTYKIVSNQMEMMVVPKNADELLAILRYRHQVLMQARHDKKPGQFKDINNRAGSTFFVDHQLVNGTLIQGFAFYNALDHPFAKAIFMMFMISEVHPFLDGNGRIARIMMNAELVHQNATKIMIPTVFREDYMGALRKMTRQSEPETYIKMMLRAQAFSASIQTNGFEAMKKYLSDCNAFEHHDNAKLTLG